MHSMHCFFALGLFISPLISRPFLTGRQRLPGMVAFHSFFSMFEFINHPTHHDFSHVSEMYLSDIYLNQA